MKLFTRPTLGGVELKNRVVLAPMTRARSSQPGDIPNAMMAEYYAQRASAGLMISEGVPISPAGRGYSLTPGIYSDAQIEGWRLVCHAVRKAGGKIFAQLWHVGRRSHPSISGCQPLAPSALKVSDQVYGPIVEGGYGSVETATPKRMTLDDIRETQNDFCQAALNAMEAGFDGVEIHGAHGYLLDQFLQSSSNERDDQYGGEIANRCRFVVEVCQQVADTIGANKVGLRHSPFIAPPGQPELAADAKALSLFLVQSIADIDLAYLHFSESSTASSLMSDEYRGQVRKLFPGLIIVAGGYDRQRAEYRLKMGDTDLVAFGQDYVTNPDLVERLRNGWPLREVDDKARQRFYGGGIEGYTDYRPYKLGSQL